MTIGTKLHTWRHGKHVGSDELGNRYFVEKKTKDGVRARRWVVYATGGGFWVNLFGFGLPDPSNVPPEWHGWLHYTTDATPADAPRVHHAWQKSPKPNMSGTTDATLPGGHMLNPKQRQKNVADYQAWKPE